MNDNTQENAITSLYHPNGCKVSLNFILPQGNYQAQAKYLLEAIDCYTATGFTVNLPGLMDGENFEQIGFAVRREKVNDDNTSTPVVDVYPANGNFRVLGLYLNAAEDVKNFQAATGLTLEAMPLYDGNPIERGKNPKQDKYVVPVKITAKAVWKLNPRWEGDEDKKHAKRQFVRWEGLRPANGEQPATIEQDAAYAEAGEVLTPGGNKLNSLTVEQLKALASSASEKITPEMRKAAKIRLGGK